MEERSVDCACYFDRWFWLHRSIPRAMFTTFLMDLFVRTRTRCLLYSALALTSVIGLLSSPAVLATASIVSSVTGLPVSFSELFFAKRGVGATAPRAILLVPKSLPFTSEATATETTDITFSFRFAARIQ